MNFDKSFFDFLAPYVTDARKELIERVLEERTRHISVVFEDLYQGQNISAVLRTCECFGIQDQYFIQKKHEFNLAPRVVRGAQKWLSSHVFEQDGVNNTLLCLEKLRKENYQIIATSPHANDDSLSELDLTQKTAFVFGAEKEGISDDVKQNVDGIVKIPMYGFTESLNISVAASIILSQTIEKLKVSEIDWKLSSEEKQSLRLEWYKKSINQIESLTKYYKNKKEK